MRIVAQLRIKNALLYQAVQKCGSQSALARYLGVTPPTIGSWLNFKNLPKFRSHCSPKRRRRYEELDAALVALIGYGLEEIFPEELEANQNEIAQAAKRDIQTDVPIENLIQAGAIPQLPPSPFDQVKINERSSAIETALSYLTPREADVIKLRFGLNDEEQCYTLKEVGEMFAVRPERIRAIEAKALRNLRKNYSAKILRDYWP